ncbi:MAG TPA: PDZ domain-containing protein [Gemmatimonadaceae bacterium]
MSRSAAHVPLFLTVTLAFAAGAAPLSAQRPETTTRRTVRVTVSDSSDRQLRRLERTIDSLVRAFDAADLSSAERARIGRTIDALIAQFKAQRMQLDGAGTTVKIDGPYVAGTPEPSMGPRTVMDLRGTLPPLPPVASGWIGIVVSGAPREMHQERNELMMRFLSYPEIVSVDPSSPAQRAGLAPGDTLIAYDGQDVRGADISMTRLLRPNAKITVRVRRDGRTRELPVVVAEAPSRIMIRRDGEMRGAGQSWVFTSSPDLARVPPLAPATPLPRTGVPSVPPAIATAPPTAPVMLTLPRPFGFSPSGVAGAQLVTISDGMKRSLGLQSGVLVVTVPIGTPADESGLKEGDVIFRVERQPVQSVVQVWQIVTRAAADGEREVDLDLIREKQARAIKLHW